MLFWIVQYALIFQVSVFILLNTCDSLNVKKDVLSCKKELRTYKRLENRNMHHLQSSYSISSRILASGEFKLPYIPKCRMDDPNLFESRQCSQHDCFCVNMTNGAALLGTHRNLADKLDCSTALYSIQLFIRQSDYATPLSQEFDPTADSYFRMRIRDSLEKIFLSSPGYQRIVNVTNLGNTLRKDSIDYRAKLLSTGHLSINGPKDLLKDRLYEGHIDNIGYVDVHNSKVTLLESRTPDPTLNDMPGSRFPVVEHKSLGTGLSTSRRSLSSSSNNVHQNWPSSTSGRRLIRQPGVIAGIVGGVVLLLLLTVLLILFCIYRLRKKDEGSYALEEPPKKSPVVNPYIRPPTREFYA